MQRMLNIPLPPPDDIAEQYGFGYGEDFEIDYELLAQAHSYELPAPIRLRPDDNAQPVPTLQLPPLGPTVAAATLSDCATHTGNNTSPPLPLLPPAEHTAAITNESTNISIATPPATPTTQTAHSKGRRSKFSPAELEELARVVYSINPYGAKHGDKKSQWEEVAKKLKDKGMFSASSVDTIRNKMTALLAYFEVSLLFTRFNRELKPLPRIPILVSARRSHGSFRVPPPSLSLPFLIRSRRTRQSQPRRVMSRRRRLVQ